LFLEHGNQDVEQARILRARGRGKDHRLARGLGAANQHCQYQADRRTGHDSSREDILQRCLVHHFSLPMLFDSIVNSGLFLGRLIVDT
jgi:hypothetical protein